MVLLVSGEFGPFWILIGLTGLGLIVATLFVKRSPLVPLPVWSLLNVLLMGFFAVDLFLLSRSLLISTSHLLMLLIISRALNLKTGQEYLHLYLISFLQLLAGTTLTIDLSYGVMFVLYSLTLIWALLLYHLVMEQGGPDLAAGRMFRTRITLPFFGLTNGMAMVSLAITAFLFLTFPRIGIGFFQSRGGKTVQTSGFSETVRLGEIGPIKLNSATVMRINLKGAMPPVPLYWRGMVFDAYDGQAWKDNLGKGRVVLSDADGRYYLRSVKGDAELIEQEILLEPLDTAVIFGAPEPVRVQGRLYGLRVNAASALQLSFNPSIRIQYTVFSRPVLLTPSDRRLTVAEALPHLHTDTIESYLQLPPGMDRVATLSREAAGDEQNLYQMVRRVERFLKNNYRYTLDVRPPAAGMSPIEDFLFVQKAGYCEHYATAMTLMLRTLGVPARLAAGFLSGEWNEYGRYYTVRQSDAHTWVEVWFPGSGWVLFDPTPPAEDEPAWTLTAVTQYFDALRWKWDRYVVFYSLRDQATALSELSRRTREAGERLQGLMAWIEALAPVSVPRAAWIITAGVVLLGYLILRRRIGFHWSRLFLNRRSATTPWTFYGEMLDLLAGHGIVKNPAATPHEFLRKIRGRSFGPQAQAVTEAYCAVRFGHRPLGPDEQRSLRTMLNRLSEQLRASV
jgi:hypothetical protein